MSAERLLRGTVSRGICWLRRLATVCLLWVKATCAPQKVMSALPPKANTRGAALDVRYGPIAGILACGRCARAAPFNQKL
jgi:hypothetical protein